MIIQNVKLVNVGYVVDVQPIVTQNLLANYDAATGISGSTFNDSSGNGYNATIFNSPTTTTYNSTTVLSLDSASSQYFTYTGGYPDATNGMYLGGVKDYFKGYIGAVKLYSIGLTQAQVTQNFNALRGRYGV